MAYTPTTWTDNATQANAARLNKLEQGVKAAHDLAAAGGGGGGGVTDHGALTGRDAPDQHPVSAVTGLQAALDGKAGTGHTHTPASIGAATAAQGGLADSAVQPGDDAATLGSGSATSGRVLTADGSGATSWQEGGGGGGVPLQPGAVAVPASWWFGGYGNSGSKTAKAMGEVTDPTVFVVPVSVTVDQVGIQVGTADAAGSARVLLYSAEADGTPSDLVINQLISLAATGNAIATLPSPVVLPGGTYWGYVRSDSATATIDCMTSAPPAVSAADTFNRLRNSLTPFMSYSPGTYAAPSNPLALVGYAGHGISGVNKSPVIGFRRSA